MVTSHTRLGFNDEVASLFFDIVGGDDPGVSIDGVAAVVGFAACADAKDLALAPPYPTPPHLTSRDLKGSGGGAYRPLPGEEMLLGPPHRHLLLHHCLTLPIVISSSTTIRQCGGVEALS